MSGQGANSHGISIHALLAESDGKANKLAGQKLVFLSTLSLRRATVHYDNYNLHCVISIHALLAESDTIFLSIHREKQNISIHALLAESDASRTGQFVSIRAFLSTLSLRRATQVFQRIAKPFRISIHALLAESDVEGDQFFYYANKFLSTLSLRRATLAGPSGPAFLYNFYPRSPCGERLAGPSGPAFLYNFYPRSPCGERPCITITTISIVSFLSTLSLRRATGFGSARLVACTYFYPRSPCGERLSFMLYDTSSLIFLSTLSLRRATLKRFLPMCIIRHFYPRSPCGERQQKCTKQWGTFCAYETNFIGIASSC